MIGAGLFLCLEAIEIAVAPIVVTSFVSVKGQPKVALSRSELDGEDTAPAAEAAVGMTEFHFLHAVLAVNAVVGALGEGVTAREVELTVHAQERAARFESAFHDASADIAEITERIF